MWHLHFDEADEFSHVCDFHREIARSVACPDADEDGDCSHVQHFPCRCTEVFPCAVCPDELEMLMREFRACAGAEFHRTFGQA